jgi:hypothetical protein
VNFSATCTFKFSLPATSAIPNTDTIAAQVERAANEVAQAGRGDIYTGPAQAQGVDPAVLAAGTTVAQGPNSTAFAVIVTNDQGSTAAALANRMCDEYVARVSAQVGHERDSETTGLQSKIAALSQSIAGIQATPAAQRSASDQAFLTAQLQAVDTDEKLLAQVLALPPDDIAVVTQSPGGVRNDTRSLGRNLLVAGVAALLACFLVILVGEVARDQRVPRGT